MYNKKLLKEFEEKNGGGLGGGCVTWAKAALEKLEEPNIKLKTDKDGEGMTLMEFFTELAKDNGQDAPTINQVSSIVGVVASCNPERGGELSDCFINYFQNI